MDTMEKRIALSDGTSSALDRMIGAAERMTDKFSRIGAVTNKLAQAMDLAAAGVAAVSAAAKRMDASVNAAAMARRFGAARDDAAGGGGFGAPKGIMERVKGYLPSFGQISTGIAQSLGRVAELSDAYSDIKTRLHLVAGSQQKAAELNDQIFASAIRARVSYAGMEQAVSKVAMSAKDVFPDPRTVVPFMENAQKMLRLGGADAARQQTAKEQLTQSLGNGRVDGRAFASLTEAAPMIQPIVAQYLGVNQEELTEMANHGEITAETLKNSILGATDEINARFNTLPLTWQDISTQIESEAFSAFAPVFDQLIALANSPAVKSFVEALVWGMRQAALAVSGVINNIRWLGGIIGAMYETYRPVFDGIGTALLFLVGIWAIYEAGIAAAAIATGAWAAVTVVTESIGILAMMITDLASLFMGLGVAETYAALSGTAMWFAILWPVALVIGVIYLIVAAINYFAGTSVSATGIIVGVFYWLGGAIYNIVALVWNSFLRLAEFLTNLFNHPAATIQNLFASVWNGIVELVGRSINKIIELINKLPGMEIGFIDWAKGLRKKVEIKDSADYSGYDMGYKTDMFEAGYKVGNDISNMKFGMPGPEKIDDPRGRQLGSIAQSGQDTAANTGAMKEAMDITNEDIKYMRDAAEQDAINKYTTAEIKIEMGGVQQNIQQGIDLDGVMNHMVDRIQEGMAAGAEAAHP